MEPPVAGVPAATPEGVRRPLRNGRALAGEARVIGR